MICNYFLPDISAIYISRYNDESLNYFVQDDKITISANTNFAKFNFEKAAFTQKRVSDARGTYFQKQFDITIPDINDQSAYRLEGRSLAVIFEDNNGNRFVTGHEKAYSLDKMDSTLNADANMIELSLVQNSYSAIQPLQSSGATTIEGTYIDTSNSGYLDVASAEWDGLANSQITISFMVRFSDVNTDEIIISKNNQYRFRKSGAQIHFELSPNNGVSYQTVSTQTPVLPNDWYFVFGWVTAPNMYIFVRNQSNGDGDVQALTGMTGTGLTVESPYKFSLNSANEVQCMGVWSRDISSDSYLLDNNQFNYYADLDPTLMTRLMAYWDNNVPNVDVIEDKHIHNIDLTLQIDDD